MAIPWSWLRPRRASLRFAKIISAQSGEVFVFVVGALVGEDEGLFAFEDVALSPVGLVEDAVEVFNVDGFGLGADGFEHASEAEIFGGAEVAVAGFVDEVEGGFGEGVMGEAGAVELVVDEVGDVGGREWFEFGGLGDAGEDFFVLAHSEQGHEFELADEDEVVVFGEVFEKEADFFEDVGGDEVGVVDDEDEALAALVELAGFGEDVFFDGGVESFAFELKSLGEEAEEAVPTEDGPVDDDGVPGLLGELEEGLFEDGFAGAGFSDDDGEATEEGLFFDAVVALFLVGQEFVLEFFVGLEGGDCGPEVGVNHGLEEGG